jgi:hypothetical protein
MGRLILPAWLRLAWSLAIVTAIGAGCSDSHSPTEPMTPAPAPTPSAAVNVSGIWTGTYKTNDNLDCDPNQILAAQAAFQQNGTKVTGTLTADGPCGLGYTFAGTILGSTLSGNITAYGFSGGTAQGTLSGGILTLEAFNSYRYDMGQLQLHR